ncbi:hypothetical protein [Methylobacterium sp. JK268]
MAAPYFLQRLGRGFTMVYATVTGGVPNANKIVATGSAGTLDPTLFPAGIGQDIANYPTSEALAAGAQVNLYNNSGTLTARNADASAANGGKQSDGFVLSAVTSGGTAAVYRNGGLNTGVTGLTPGSDYWLGTGGAVTATQNTTAGQTDQYIGKASAAGVLDQLPPQIAVAVN